MRPRTFRIPLGVEMTQGFACAHCGNRRQLFRSPATAGRHVELCIRNPRVRACATCANDDRADGSCAEGARPAGETVIRRCVAWTPRS